MLFRRLLQLHSDSNLLQKILTSLINEICDSVMSLCFCSRINCISLRFVSENCIVMTTNDKLTKKKEPICKK